MLNASEVTNMLKFFCDEKMTRSIVSTENACFKENFLSKSEMKIFFIKSRYYFFLHIK